jgi:biopolymer transport protein ExbD/biopolymer transport protein TolR
MIKRGPLVLVLFCAFTQLNAATSISRFQKSEFTVVGGNKLQRKIYCAGAFSLLAILLFAVACFKKPPQRTVANNGVPIGVNVLLPRSVNNAESEPAALQEPAVVISVLENDQFYVGRERIPKDELGYQISKLLKTRPESNRIVYIAGGNYVEFGAVLSAIEAVRKEGIKSVALLVDMQSKTGNAPSVLRVQIPPEPDPNEDLSNLRPNPLTLVASVSPDLKLELNREPAGTASDTSNLSQTLTRIFQQRRELHAYKRGSETRTDLPEDERVEKTVTVKAWRSNKYGDVVRLVDVVKGAGANPIILQVDDLPQ